MKGVDYTKALKALPPYCPALMQNAPEDQQVLSRALETLDPREVEPSVKALLYGVSAFAPASEITAPRGILESRASGALPDRSGK